MQQCIYGISCILIEILRRKMLQNAECVFLEEENNLFWQWSGKGQLKTYSSWLTLYIRLSVNVYNIYKRPICLWSKSFIFLQLFEWDVKFSNKWIYVNVFLKNRTRCSICPCSLPVIFCKAVRMKYQVQQYV